MGLFNRKNPYEKEALDLESALRSTADRPEARPPQKAPQQAMTAPQPPMPQAPAPTPPPMAAAAPTLAAKTPSYGVEDAIKLMRELPDNKKEMVITIVQKTLVSAKINVSTIIDDATRKIDRLEKKNEKLAQEIRELEEAIQQRKAETEINARDIVETSEVKSSFESVQKHVSEDYSAVPSPFVPSHRAG